MDFGRVITALVTPLGPEGEVDFPRAGQLARRLADQGSDGFVVSGTTGESPTLDHREKLGLLAAVREAVDGRAFVWFGAGNYDTAGSVALAREAAAAGAQGILAVVPYYNKPPQEGLYRHFRAIADASPLPVMLYNVPSRTGCNLLPATVARLVADEPRIAAIKEASGSLDQVSEIRRLCPAPFRIYSGDDSLTLPVMACGGSGIVSVASHVAASEVRAMVDRFLGGDAAGAEALHRRLMPLFKVLFVTTNPIPVKYALGVCGFPVGGYRLPLCEPTDAEAAAIRRVLAELGLAAGA
jgi:4-hydroxy-tetrahydrodipicolinate synthase